MCVGVIDIFFNLLVFFMFFFFFELLVYCSFMICFLCGISLVMDFLIVFLGLSGFNCG